MKYVQSELRALMIERDNMQASWFWRNPHFPQKSPQLKMMPRKAPRRVKLLRKSGWKLVKSLQLWKDPISGRLLDLNRAYYLALQRTF